MPRSPPSSRNTASDPAEVSFLRDRSVSKGVRWPEILLAAHGCRVPGNIVEGPPRHSARDRFGSTTASLPNPFCRTMPQAITANDRSVSGQRYTKTVWFVFSCGLGLETLTAVEASHAE